MVKLTDNFQTEKEAFQKAGILVPSFNEEKMREQTLKTPQWVHFGGGNLYRCFHAKVAQELLNKKEMDTGIIVVDTFGDKLINEAYKPFNHRTLSVIMKADGSVEKEAIASTAQAHFLTSKDEATFKQIVEVFKKTSLQLVTLTITEKGYTVKDTQGKTTPQAKKEINNGPVPSGLTSAMGMLTYLMYERYLSGEAPIALVSTDNFSHNGEHLKDSVTTIAKGWVVGEKVEQAFYNYLVDENKVSFPFSMIDRITPLPSKEIERQLTDSGIEEMAFEEGSAFAPFVNTEETSYLVVEDNFPNGRPDLSKGGVYLTDRETVNNADMMKVCTCLNPLHTALAITGCLLGYEKISDEVRDEDLLGLIEQVGYVEGLPVVVNPKIIDPKAFIDEVVHVRLVNPNIPDTPQRIACDTSQKVGIRFGETIQAYAKNPQKNIAELHFIPWVIAAWCRYLIGVRDDGEKMTLSPDPLLKELQAQLGEIKLGEKIAVHERLQPILSNAGIFSVDLYEVGLAEKIEAFFGEMIAGKNKVRDVLHRELKNK